jgi:hypothetical protein
LGEPLVRLDADGVTCLLCGKFLEQAGKHFTSVHGFDFEKRTPHSERQRILGLPQGARLASAALLQRYRESATANLRGVALMGGRQFTEDDYRRSREAVGAIPKSPTQIAAVKSLLGTPRHGGAVVHDRARCERVCATCGVLFVTTHGDDRKTCSKQCKVARQTGRRTTWSADALERFRVLFGVRRMAWTACATCRTTIKVSRGRAEHQKNFYCSLACSEADRSRRQAHAGVVA